jgi:hypothetical protein
MFFYKKNAFNLILKMYITLLSILFLLKAISTLKWRMEHDTPLLYYAAFLINHYKKIPYLDIYETSMPGTFFFHYLIAKLFGYSDMAFRYIDLGLLSILIISTHIFMKRFGNFVSLLAVILFALLYFAKGQTMSLQRDYIGIIPIAFSLLLIPHNDKTPIKLSRFMLAGLLFGASALIKPHLVIGLPILFYTLIKFRQFHNKKSSIDLLLCAVSSIAGLLIPLLISIAWLEKNGALDSFLTILTDYLPLHNNMTGYFSPIHGMERFRYLIHNTFLLGGYFPLLICSLFSHFYYHIKNDPHCTNRLSKNFLLYCTFAYAIYPTLAGKFWEYHYMPFVYFASLSSGLCVFNFTQQNKALRVSFKTIFMQHAFSLICLALITIQLSLPNYIRYLNYDLSMGRKIHAPKNGRVDEIARWLKARLNPGDTVQPLDWTGGSIHAMLIAKAQLATTFLYDYHFYHHTHLFFIQQLRSKFIHQLQTTKPRFIIAILTNKPWVFGVKSTSEFPELQHLLDNNYFITKTGDGYLIYERNADHSTHME